MADAKDIFQGTGAVCGNCLFWSRVQNPADVSAELGQCRRFPPTIVLLPGHGPTPCQPNTPAGDLCGEWKGIFTVDQDKDPKTN